MSLDRTERALLRVNLFVHSCVVGLVAWTGTATAQTLGAAAASAQDTGQADSIQEIIVTAQRFAEPLSKAPITLSALTEDELEARHVTSVQDFNGVVPGLVMNYFAGRPLANIRGVGVTQVSGSNYSQVAINIDGVYIGSAFATGASFLDLERVEVLRGPQGTLYGRNATAGAINLITAKPTSALHASVDLTYGNFQNVETAGVVSGPLSNKVSGRLAFARDHHQGYSLNLFDGKNYDDEDWRAVRGTLLFELSDLAKLTVTADYYHRDDGSNPIHFLGFASSSQVLPGVVLGGSTIPLDANGQAVDPRLLNINSTPHYRINDVGISANLEWTLSDAITLRSISAYRQARVNYDWDLDYSTYPASHFSNPNDTKQQSQEFQLLGETGRLKWVTGLYYNKRYVDPNTALLGVNFSTPQFPFYANLSSIGTLATTAYAAFGQATLALTDRLSATAGLRYSYEHNAATNVTLIPAFFVAASDTSTANFRDWSPKFTLSYQATDGLLVYGTVSKGFLGGGYAVNQQPPLSAYGPETLRDTEAGVKYRRRSWSIDLAAFHYDYKDLQVSQIVRNLPRTVNAANAKVNGAELATTIQPLSHLELTGSFSYTDSEYTKYSSLHPVTGVLDDLAGNPLAGSAKYQTNLYASYYVPVGENRLTFAGEWNYRSRVYFDEFAFLRTSQAEVGTVNASVRFGAETGRWYADVYGKNLGNKVIAITKFVDSPGAGLPIIGQIAPPRTFGVQLHYQLGK